MSDSIECQFDVIIVGAGIAGLRVGLGVLDKHPKASVIILEKYNYIGGRVVTYRKDDVQYEIGAGRISKDHHLVMQLINKYKLSWVPLDSRIDWRPVGTGDAPRANPFSSLIPTYIEPFKALSNEYIRTKSLSELLTIVHGESNARKFYQMFPYYAEMRELRADIAIEAFLHEMRDHKGFGVCGEGYQAITDAMAVEFVKNGGIILKQSIVKDVQPISDDNAVIVKCENGAQFIGKTCVLATHYDALREMPYVRNHLPILKHLQMSPLVRMYAKFPKIRGRRMWFTGIPHTVTNSPVRYFIPIDVNNGLVMISYTDGADAIYWMRMQNRYGDDRVHRQVMYEIRRIFSDHDIPEPILFKIHPWTSGCTYWKPGSYDLESEAPAVGNSGAIFACGESFSHYRQAWCQGALESADCLLERADFLKRLD